MFFHHSHTSCCLNQQQSFQCRILPTPSPSLPSRKTTGLTTFVLGMNTSASPRLIFIQSNITTRHVKNMQVSTRNISWSFATMSPRSLVGIIRLDGLPRTAPIRMDTSISAPERNTRFKEKTHSSRISVSK